MNTHSDHHPSGTNESEVKKMNWKNTGNRFLFAIPHFCELFNMRQNQRYALPSELDAEIRIQDMQHNLIAGRLMDISFDGMKLRTSDRRMEGLTAISLSVENSRVDLPCKRIWQDGDFYRIEFENLDSQEFADVKYFVEHFVKTQPDDLLELLM
jgi:hypothetical protein